MRPEIPRELVLHPGPVASVYLEVSRDRGAAPHEVRLRWETLAGQLREQGADDKTIDAAGEAATEVHHQPGGAGRAGIQHRTEEVWARDARAFAAEVDRAVAALRAELVVLTGDVRAGSLVRDALGAPPSGEQPALVDGLGALLQFTSTS